MKQRFSSLDVKVIAHELSSSLVSLRVSNIYDLSSRIFLFKFAKPEQREQLIIDSGFRCHLTTFARATAAAPSPFIARLRKYLRTRRVTSVAQIGTDRIIDIQFSDGQYHLFLEFYAGGNIVLTDNELNIIALLRNVDEGAEHERYRLGLKYNLSLRQNYEGIPPLTKERVRAGLEKAIERQSQESGKAGKIKKKPGDALRKALAVSITEFPPVVLDHVFELTGFDKTVQPSEVLENEDTLDKLMAVFDEATKVLADITAAETVTGYIVSKRSKKPADDDKADADKSKGLMYDDFHPFKPKQLESNPDNVFLEFTGFNKTVDEFFSSIEGQKLESKLTEREEQAKKRLEAARQEHARRIGSLQQTQELNITKAQAIEANLDRVEEATAAVNGLVAQGMDWVEISRLIEMEQSRNNPVAEIIKLPLKLEENTVTLLLSDYSFEEEEEMGDVTESDSSDSEDEDRKKSTKGSQKEDKRLTVDIDLSLSGWSNARQYYDQKRVAATKQEKTEQASTKALKSTEQRIQADLRKGLKQEKQVLRPVRKQLWFEKFIYFISSDGYLVLGGKDAQQNELLYRRHLKKGDIYVHADLHGASSVIIKNNPGLADFEIPPSTLSQAGNLSVCTSSAWDSKAVMSAWWVNADQVSKTAPTGEYLTTGGFMIRGKKNFLPPAQLLLGFAVIWQISEESKAKHVKHRLKNDDVRGMTQEANSKAAAATNDDSDDDFPDAGKEPDASDDEFPDVKDEGKAEESDEDDDFSDAQKRDASPGSEEARSPEERSNPLQPQGSQKPREQAPNATNEDTHQSGSESEDEEDGEEEGTKHEDSETAQPQPEDKKAGNKGKAGAQKDASNKPKQNKPVRGKRGKAKKAAQKYADQDEEDRRLAMEILGSKAAEEKREAEEQLKAQKAESAEAAKARRRAQHEKAQREGLEAEEIRRLNLEEGIDALDEEESSAATQLDAYVGTPLPGDEILEAIPVCAPWAALAKYKYKVKLQPGTQKKGRAIREIMDSWAKAGTVNKWVDQSMSDVERIWPRELELIKNWKDVEVIGVLPVSKVRVMMSGGAHGGGGGGGGQKGGKKGGRGGKGSKKR